MNATEIKYRRIIPGYVKVDSLNVEVIRIHGSWKVKQYDKWVKSFATLANAKAFIADKLAVA